MGQLLQTMKKAFSFYALFEISFQMFQWSVMWDWCLLLIRYIFKQVMIS